MKRYLLTICLIAGTGVVSYGQSTMNRSTATATATVGVTVTENAQQQQQENVTQEKLVFAGTVSEMDANLSRGRDGRAENVFKQAQDQMLQAIARNEERLGAVNGTDKNSLDKLVVKQKMLYNDVKILSADLAKNRAEVKAKMDEFLNTL